MKIKLMSLALLFAILFGAVALPSTVAAKKGLTTAVTGTTDDGGTFEGKYQITEFAVQTLESGEEAVVAVGTLSGKLYDADGKKIGNVHKQEVAMPLQRNLITSATAGIGIAQATCDILNLVLGPLDLNLLGLEVHLDTVVLDIVANPAKGLLGELLCGVANLLGNPSSLLQDIVDALNGILDILG